MEKTLTTKFEHLTHFERIFINEESWDTPVADRFRRHNPAAEVIRLPAGQSQAVTTDLGPLTAEQFARSKRWVHLKAFPGSFFKRCPGFSQKKALTCCNYHVLNLGQQCNFNCSYCYLQSYLNAPTMMVYTNLDDALNELQEMARLHSQSPFRIGTGEVIDSLSLDPTTLFSRELIQFFRQLPNWTLEMKTKSALVDQFLDCEHAGNVLISWSVNTQEIIAREEHGTASQLERLAAAEKCAQRGFQIGFHIDPLIWHPNWEQGYADLVAAITSRFTPDQVGVLSVGTLRFQPEQRHMMRERFGATSHVVRAEMFSSESGKMRYDQNLRQTMYRHVRECFQKHSRDWQILMCMETPETWISQYGEQPVRIDGLRDQFKALPPTPSKLRNRQPTL